MIANSPEKTKFGLPEKVLFCARCVTSNQRPNSTVEFAHTRDSRKATIGFDDAGVCAACRVAEMKKREIDWKKREAELRGLCERFRRSDGSYDCIVPGSGGKDSFYAAHMLKNEYGMHPLTITWAPHIYTPWGWKNFQSWMQAGFDNSLFTPNGRVHRLLTRLALENLLHPFQPFIMGQKAFPPKTAAALGIPLVFYGENEAEYGNPIADIGSARRNAEYFSAADADEAYFGGISKRELMSAYGLCEHDFAPYLPAPADALEKSGVEVYYLGYYLKWHPQSCYYYAVEHGGFTASPERTPGTYSKYVSIDDKMDDFNFYTMFVKFGIGRATSDAAQEVRSGDITREEGVALVRRFDGEYPARFEKELFEYLTVSEKEFPKAAKQFAHPQMDKEYFMELADRFRSPHLWKKEKGEWKLKHQVS